MNRKLVLVSAIGVSAIAFILSQIERRTVREQDVPRAVLLQEIESELSSMESAVSIMTAHEAILENEIEYDRGLDRHDESLVRNIFWPDAALSYGSRVTIADLPAWANASHANRAAIQHHVTTLNVDLDGDTAHVEGYIVFSSDMPRDTSFDSPGAPTPGRARVPSITTLSTGRYINRYERRDGDWRISVHDYVHELGAQLETVDLCAIGCLGRWDQTDLSYLRPLQPLSVEERRQRAELGRAPRSRAAPSTGPPGQ